MGGLNQILGGGLYPPSHQPLDIGRGPECFHDLHNDLPKVTLPGQPKGTMHPKFPSLSGSEWAEASLEDIMVLLHPSFSLQPSSWPRS